MESRYTVYRNQPMATVLSAAMRRLLPALAVAAGWVFVADAQAADDQYWCSKKAAPCIVSASRNGTPVTPSDPVYDVTVTAFSGDGSEGALWNVQRSNGDHDLGAAALGDHWSVTLDLYHVAPGVASQYADNVTVKRAPASDGTVTIAGDPVTVEEGGDCDTSAHPWTCPNRAKGESKALLQGRVIDYDSSTDLQRRSMRGMNYSTNVAATSIPPEIENDPATGADQLLLRLANHHLHPDGSVFEGFVHLRIPNFFLRVVYEIDNPSTLTASGLKTTGAGGGTVSITQETGRDAMLVDVTGITFSQRLLRIRRGKIVPTKPTRLRAERTGRHSARIRFHRSKPRGSNVTSYVVRCSAKNASARAFATHPRLHLTALVEGRAYRCRVRARSKAGAGPKSKRVTIPAHAG
jgi:hypothetical protein